MIPIKIQCACGQRYAFDAEPVNGCLASPIACPACGTDGTEAANGIIAQTLGAVPPPLPPSLPAAGMKLRLDRGSVSHTPASSVPAGNPPASTPIPARPPAMPPAISTGPATGEFNMGLGILGAVLGAAVGTGIMYGFYEWANFRFPLMGVGIGVLTGLGARLLFKGTDNTLGIISGAIAAVAVFGSLFLMYGTFPLLSIISVAVSVSMAYKIAG